ncbi:MAG: DUF362 domain-containing protein [Theionarchaea archaeon]|nr:DUF362 domain-containing protein [Theionarchaea archaeon]MBU7037755.1 DUF362 domain-containing protein [Theionarchaea archaeon]
MRIMTRREFFREGAGLFLSASLLERISRFAPVLHASSGTELVIAQNGTPGELVDAALKGIGGIGKVVRKGQKVVIKVNMSFNQPPSRAATTNPELVGRLVEICREAGASEVVVVDNTLENGRMCMDTSEIKDAVVQAGGKIKVIDSRGDYEEVDIPLGRKLKKTELSKEVLGADVFINVPIAKVHGSAKITVSMKNLMGVVWNRGEFHTRGLDQCIADLSSLVKPDLIVLDAYRILMSNGPRGPGKVNEVGEVVVGVDPVAIDRYACELLERDSDDVGHLTAAYEMGLGEIDLDKVQMVYVDAQKGKDGSQVEPSEVETSDQDLVSPQEGPVAEEKESGVEEPLFEKEERGEVEEENEVGIPAILLIPAIIVSVLIGLRMRRHNVE